jgi:hypothetical protein
MQNRVAVNRPIDRALLDLEEVFGVATSCRKFVKMTHHWHSNPTLTTESHRIYRKDWLNGQGNFSLKSA